MKNPKKKFSVPIMDALSKNSSSNSVAFLFHTKPTNFLTPPRISTYLLFELDIIVGKNVRRSSEGLKWENETISFKLQRNEIITKNWLTKAVSGWKAGFARRRTAGKILNGQHLHKEWRGRFVDADDTRSGTAALTMKKKVTSSRHRRRQVTSDLS